MSELVSFGVECKNPECKTAMVLGEMYVRPTRAGDPVTFSRFDPQKIKCKACNQEHEYIYDDLRQFPLVEGESGAFPPGSWA